MKGVLNELELETIYNLLNELIEKGKVLCEICEGRNSDILETDYNGICVFIECVSDVYCKCASSLKPVSEKLGTYPLSLISAGVEAETREEIFVFLKNANMFPYLTDDLKKIVSEHVTGEVPFDPKQTIEITQWCNDFCEAFPPIMYSCEKLTRNLKVLQGEEEQDTVNCVHTPHIIEPEMEQEIIADMELKMERVKPITCELYASPELMGIAWKREQEMERKMERKMEQEMDWGMNITMTGPLYAPPELMGIAKKREREMAWERVQKMERERKRKIEQKTIEDVEPEITETE
jgi:hypothetical protein